jgi:hypothetical protein
MISNRRKTEELSSGSSLLRHKIEEMGWLIWMLVLNNIPYEDLFQISLINKEIFTNSNKIFEKRKKQAQLEKTGINYQACL